MAEQGVLEVYREGDEICILLVQIPDSVDEQTETHGITFTRWRALGVAWLIVKHALRR